jgi:hypothetical protein
MGVQFTSKWGTARSPNLGGEIWRWPDVFSTYGHKFIDAVTAADIREVMLAVAARDARDVAKRVHETTGQIFRYAIAHGIATRNPAADFKPGDILAQANSENFARVDSKELPDLLVKMEGYDGGALTRLAMRLMAYTRLCAHLNSSSHNGRSLTWAMRGGTSQLSAWKWILRI